MQGSGSWLQETGVGTGRTAAGVCRTGEGTSPGGRNHVGSAVDGEGPRFLALVRKALGWGPSDGRFSSSSGAL